MADALGGHANLLIFDIAYSSCTDWKMCVISFKNNVESAWIVFFDYTRKKVLALAFCHAGLWNTCRLTTSFEINFAKIKLIRMWSELQ